MTNSTPKRPTNWDDYEHGRSPRQGSVGSLNSRVHFDAPSPTSTSGRLNIPQNNGANGGNGGNDGSARGLHRRR